MSDSDRLMPIHLVRTATAVGAPLASYGHDEALGLGFGYVPVDGLSRRLERCAEVHSRGVATRRGLDGGEQALRRLGQGVGRDPRRHALELGQAANNGVEGRCDLFEGTIIIT